jgi:hypothetical protein
VLIAPDVYAALPTSAPSLPAPSGPTVHVSTEPQLQAAVNSLGSGTTIVIAPGVYNLTSTLYINGTFSNVGIRGATNNPSDVVLVGKGMANGNYGNVPFGIWMGGNVQGALIANLTVRDVYFSPIQMNPGTHAARLYHVDLINAGEQFVKGAPGVDLGIVEYCTLAYETTARSDYTNGVDLKGPNWIVRHNLFKNIVAPSGSGLLAGPAVLAWQGSSNPTIEGNTFVNCQREIAVGLTKQSGFNDNSGGAIVRNNFIYRAATVANSDVAIGVADSPNTKVLNNTALINGTYPNAIEYRFTTTTGVVIRNNLIDAAILARQGGTGTVSSNVVNATAAMFVSASTGDLHLKSTSTTAIDRGVTLADVATDWDGTQRPAGSAVDVGADEQDGGAVPTAPGPPHNLRIVP